MAHSTSSSPEVPPVFQAARDSGGGPVIWRPLAESFNIVKTSRAPGGGFTVYQVVFKVWTETPERGPVIQECEIWKRYSDFQHLSKQLESIHSHSRQVTPFPSIVKAKYFERFKESVIEERKKSAEALLYFASYYQHLAESQPLRQFLSGAKVVGRLAADPSMMMAGSISDQASSPTVTIPSYPNFAFGDVDPTSTTSYPPPPPPFQPTSTTSDQQQHHIDTAGEEQLAAGSSLNTHKASAADPPPLQPSDGEAKGGESLSQSDARTADYSGRGKEGVASGDDRGNEAREQQDSLGPQIKGAEGKEHLSVPEAGGGDRDVQTVSSGASSATESWEDLEKVNGVMHHSESNVSLDNAELDIGGGEQGRAEVEGNKGVDDLEVELGSVRVTEWNVAHSLKLRETDTLQPGGISRTMVSEGSESDSDERGDKERSKGDGESDSSSSKPNSPPCQGISIPGQPSSTLSPVGSQSGRGGGGGGGGGGRVSSGGEGMDWWRDAMAETQNVTDDIDSLVEQLDTETDGTKRVGGGESSGSSGINKGSNPFPLQSQSSSAAHGRASEKKTSTVSSLSSDGVVNVDLNDGGRRVSRDRDVELRMVAGYSSTDSVNSTGKRSKTGSRQSSRSPSPGRRRGSPSMGEKGAYVVQAGRLIKQALSYERNAEYQEAFDLFKAGVDVLLNGVQTDQSKQRREVVRRKTAEYLKHAEELYQKHLAPSSNDGEKEKVNQLEQLPPPPSSKPHLLPDFKVVGIIGKVILVESRHTGQKYIFKVLYKSLQAMAAVGKGRSKATTNRTPRRCPHMVRLLHHYETSTHRIFLLLEYVGGGRLLDFVNGKRAQWKKLHEAATNPPPSSSLILPTDVSTTATTTTSGTTGTQPEPTPGPGQDKSSTLSVEVKEDTPDEPSDTQRDAGEGDDDDEMERMLGELARIVPPSSLPVTTSSLSSDTGLNREDSNASSCSKDDSSEPSNSIDRLALLRKRLEESVEPEELDPTAAAGGNSLTLTGISVVAAGLDDDDDDETAATINILPPTPTVPSKPGIFEHHHNADLSAEEERTSNGSGSDKTSLSVEDALIPRRSLATDRDSSTSAKVVSESVAIPNSGSSAAGGSHSNGSSTQGSPCFSPGAILNIPNTNTKADDWILRLEDKVRHWAAQIIVALDHLHNCGIVCRDLNPSNILIDNSKSAVLTYFGKWDFVESDIDYELARRLYVAPELCGLCEVDPAADWWSLGAILFEILTGKTLASCHPDGIHSHLNLRVPVKLSPEAQSLLSQLLQVSPNERLGAGLAGVEELKAHPFFAGVDWNSM